jgi:hypothetical protein
MHKQSHPIERNRNGFLKEIDHSILEVCLVSFLCFFKNDVTFKNKIT